MRNLAGDKSANASITDELGAAGVPIVPIEADQRGEVPTDYAGRLGSFTFHRAWYYWTVRGMVPESVAWEMYRHADGVKAVRVGGHCGAPPPNGDVYSYDIDTGAGLRLFADTIRRHGLDREEPASVEGGE